MAGSGLTAMCLTIGDYLQDPNRVAEMQRQAAFSAAYAKAAAERPADGIEDAEWTEIVETPRLEAPQPETGPA